MGYVVLKGSAAIAFYRVVLVDSQVIPRLVMFSTHYSELLVRHPTLKHYEYYHE